MNRNVTDTDNTQGTLEVLRSRARALATPPIEEKTSEEHIEVLEFGLAQETYAVETRYVREVVPLKEMTPLPCTPAFIAGLISLRSQILPVIDLKRFLGLPQKGLTNLHRVIVIRGTDLEFGLLADTALGVRSLVRWELQSPPTTLEGIGMEFLLGDATERLIVLDMGKMLSDPRLLVDEQPDA